MIDHNIKEITLPLSKPCMYVSLFIMNHLMLVIEPILVLNRVRARSSWLGLGAEPSADRSPNRHRIV